MNSLALHPDHARRRPSSRLLLSATVAAAALVTASSAQAQSSNPPLSQFGAPFVELVNIPGVGTITNSSCTGNDDCNTGVINLPFTFTHYGQAKTAIRACTNGWLTFDTSYSSSSYSNVAMPGSGTPNDLVAFLWDDLWGAIKYGTVGTAPNRIFVVEWSYRRLSSTGSALAQIWLYESDDSIEFRYGSTTGLSSTTYTASIGIEDSTGANGVALPCGSSCSETNLNSLVGQVLRFGSIDGTELLINIDDFPRGAFPGMSATGTVSAENLGLTPGTNVLVSMYLSSDDALDSADTLVGTATIASVPEGITTAPVTVTVPSNFAPGDYYLIAEIDGNDVIAELNESNNIAVADQLFATAYDLVGAGCSITNEQGVANGTTVNFDFDLLNQGVPYTGSIPVQVYASLDGALDMSDVVMGQATLAFSGANRDSGSGSFMLPANTLMPGTYTPICVVDPAGTLTEANTANNVAVGDEEFGVGPDFAVGAITMPGQVQPGTAVNVSTTILNAEVPYTGNVEYRLYASLDDVLDAQDLNLGLYTATMAGEDSLVDVKSVTFAATLPGARYRLIANIDPRGSIAEVDEANNEGVSDTDIVNAIDFVGRRATVSPTAVQAGTMMTVTGEAESTGLAFVGNVAVGVYFSIDDTFDGSDYEAYRGLIFFPGNTTGSINVSFPAPPVPPGTYNVMVVANPDNNPPEAQRTNNAAVALSSVTMAGADLRAETLVAPDIAFIGRGMDVTLTIRNESSEADANGFSYAYYLSENDLIRVTDRQVFVSQTASIAAGGTGTYTDRVMIPSTYTSTQTLYLGVIVDIFSNIPESNENNNVRRKPTPISIVFPIPDLVGQVVSTATAAAAGEQLAVTRLIANDGVDDSAEFDYTYYLSTNPAISTDDIELDTFQLQLAQNQDDYAIDVLQIPPSVAPGRYYVGFILDPAEEIVEVYDDNNAVVGPAINVYGAAIVFTTDELKPATVGVNYEEGLYASGGPLPISWSVEAGTLPTGITLDMQGGLLTGVPTEEGLYRFTLRASSGTAYAERDFEIRVTSPTVPLTIATTTLRSAIAGRDYTGARLVAVGGVPPYQWSVVSGEIAGLDLSEDGIVSGRPVTAGQYSLTVRVVDDVGNTASAPVAISVVSPGASIQIERVQLPSGFVGKAYCTDSNPFAFQARNAVGTQAWSAINGLPDGMNLSSEGQLCGTPTTAGSYVISVRVQDSSGLFDTGLFRLEVLGNDACAIVTVTLPTGEVEVPYLKDGNPVSLIASEACSDPVVWSLAAGAGELPEGLTLSEDGVISGTPAKDSGGAHAFLAQLVDGSNTVSLQPLTIMVEGGDLTSPEPKDDGCTCATPKSGDRSLAWLGLLPGLALVFRRRRR